MPVKTKYDAPLDVFELELTLGEIIERLKRIEELLTTGGQSEVRRIRSQSSEGDSGGAVVDSVVCNSLPFA